MSKKSVLGKAVVAAALTGAAVLAFNKRDKIKEVTTTATNTVKEKAPLVKEKISETTTKITEKIKKKTEAPTGEVIEAEVVEPVEEVTEIKDENSTEANEKQEISKTSN